MFQHRFHRAFALCLCATAISCAGLPASTRATAIAPTVGHDLEAYAALEEGAIAVRLSFDASVPALDADYASAAMAAMTALARFGLASEVAPSEAAKLADLFSRMRAEPIPFSGRKLIGYFAVGGALSGSPLVAELWQTGPDLLEPPMEVDYMGFVLTNAYPYYERDASTGMIRYSGTVLPEDPGVNWAMPFAIAGRRYGTSDSRGIGDPAGYPRGEEALSAAEALARDAYEGNDALAAAYVAGAKSNRALTVEDRARAYLIDSYLALLSGDDTRLKDDLDALARLAESSAPLANKLRVPLAELRTLAEIVRARLEGRPASP
jgi:hypothetical protein